MASFLIMLIKYKRGKVLDPVWLTGLSELLSAGVPLLTALEWFVRGLEGEDWRVQVYQRVERGETLSEAITGAGVSAGAELMTVLRVGELSGRLAESLRSMAEIEQGRRQRRSRLLRSLAYPCLLIMVALAVLVVLLVMIVPQMHHLRSLQPGGASAEAGWGVLLLLSAHWHHLLLPGVLTASVAGFAVYRYPHLVERIPWLGDRLVAYRRGRQLHLLGCLLGAGLSMEQAVQALQPAGRREQRCGSWQVVSARLREGWTFTEAISADGVLEDWVCLLTGIGEQTGSLPEQLQKAGELMERRWQSGVDDFLGMLEPGLILLMAVCVGGVGWMMLRPLLHAGF